MKDELYVKVAKRYFDKFHKIIEENNPTGRYMDISGNLVNILIGNAEILNMLEENEKREIKNIFVRSLKATRDYFNMLENFPEFRKAELHLRNGYFPELINYVYNSKNAKKERKKENYSGVHIQYVFLAKDRLKK